MTDTAISDRLEAVVADVFGASIDDLSGETVAADIDGWDSLGHLVLVTGIDREFGIKLPIMASLRAEKLADLSKLIAQTIA